MDKRTRDGTKLYSDNTAKKNLFEVAGGAGRLVAGMSKKI